MLLSRRDSNKITDLPAVHQTNRTPRWISTHKNILEPWAARRTISQRTTQSTPENTHDGTTPCTTSHPAFTTTVARRHPCARYPTEPISHSPRPNRSISPGHYPDHCRKAHLEHIHPAPITHTVPQHLQTPSPRYAPSRPFSAAHYPCPQCQSQRTAHWGLGRAGRGAGEPGPASGAASLAGSPPGAWSPMRPPRCGPGPARLPACGNHRSSSEGRTSGWKRRIWEEDMEGQEDWEDGR